MLRDDSDGQLFILKLVPIIIFIALLVFAALQIQAGAIGLGLILLGVASLVLGLEGTVTIGFGAIRISGAIGAVFVLVGAVFYIFITHR
jgi:hypothetical protein